MKIFVSMIIVSLIIATGVPLIEKINTGTPEFISNDEFNETFSSKQVYYLENDPLYFADETMGFLLSKTDNDFGCGNGDGYAVSYNPKETRFYRVSESNEGETLSKGDLVINTGGKFIKYYPLISICQ